MENLIEDIGVLSGNELETTESFKVSADENTGKTRKLYIESYGCQMNFSDSEIVASILQKEGFDTTSNIEEADLVFLNTCSIREKAEKTVRDRLHHRGRRPRARDRETRGRWRSVPLTQTQQRRGVRSGSALAQLARVRDREFADRAQRLHRNHACPPRLGRVDCVARRERRHHSARKRRRGHQGAQLLRELRHVIVRTGQSRP